MTDFRSIRLPEGSKVEMTIDAKPLLRVLADKIRVRADHQRRWAADEQKRADRAHALVAVLDVIAMRVADGEIPDALLAHLFEVIDPPKWDSWRDGKIPDEAAKLRRIFGIPEAADKHTVTVSFD